MPRRTTDQLIFDKLAELEGRSLSNTKPFYINNTSTYTDINGYAVQAHGNDVTFTTLNVVNEKSGSNGLVNATLPAGQVWYLNIKDIELASGECTVYCRS